MDLLKSVLGLGQNIGNFFSKKKKDLEDTLQTFIPKQTQAPAISPPKLSTPKIQQQKPTVPQPTPTPVSMPNLSFNQPKQAPQPQSNPLADFFKNTAAKAANVAGNTIKQTAQNLSTTKLGTNLGKTIMRPFDYLNLKSMNDTDLEEARKATDLAIKLSAQGKRDEAAALFQKSRELSQGVQDRSATFRGENKQMQGDIVKNTVGSILSLLGAGYTAANPAIPVVGGVLGGTINKIQGGSFSEGAGKGIAGALPMAGVMQFTSPAVQALAPKIASYVQNPFFQQVAGRGLVGAGNVLENRIVNAAAGQKTALADDVFAFTLGALIHSPGKNKIQGWQIYQNQQRRQSFA